MASEPLYLRVPTETRAYLAAEADRQGRPLANLAAHILNQWVQHQQVPEEQAEPEVTVGRFRPCEQCGKSPSFHNALNDDYVGHDYR